MFDMKQYIIGVVATCLCCGIIRKLVGDKSASSSLINTLCGVVISIAVISPVLKIDLPDISEYATGLQTDAQRYIQEGINYSSSQTQSIIIEKVSAYILEKALALDCVIKDVDVVVSSEAIPALESLTITGTVSPAARLQLSYLIEKNLGIPKEKQEWIYQN